MINITKLFIKKLNVEIELATPEKEEEWNSYYNLRYEILRKPWNQPPESAHANDDDTSIHLCLVYQNEMIGVCRIHYTSHSEAQIRFMGIIKTWRNHQLGDIFLTYAEERCKKSGVRKIFLQARENAIPFYERNGYRILEKTHLLFGQIQHYAMCKIID